jgi:hypothetical protein
MSDEHEEPMLTGVTRNSDGSVLIETRYGAVILSADEADRVTESLSMTVNGNRPRGQLYPMRRPIRPTRDSDGVTRI